MGDSSQGGPAPPTGAGDDEATQSFLGRDAVTQSRLTGPANARVRPSTEVMRPGPPAEAVRPGPPAEAVQPGPSAEAVQPGPPTEAVQPGPPAEVVRYGPGVPVTSAGGQAGRTAEQVWRAGPPPASARDRPRLLRLFGAALTVILLAASGVVLYVRFHHAPFQVTGLVISQRTRTGCGIDVTGRITTNGAAGTVSYQWLFLPGRQPPQPLSQSVPAGQHAAYVTVAVEGSGHGRASQTVTLQVLGPSPRTASAAVVVSC